MPEPIKKKVNEKVEALKSHVSFIFNKFYKNKLNFRENKTAIKGFAKQYVMDGVAGIDAVTFFNNVKEEVVNLLSRNYQTKVNMVLSGEMERVDMKSGAVINTGSTAWIKNGNKKPYFGSFGLTPPIELVKY